jgi:sialate O-acetylesterase
MSRFFPASLLVALAVGFSAVVQADTIVNFGASGGSDMVTANADPASIPTTYSTTSYLSPANGVNGYDTTAAGQTREYYGAMDNATKFGIGQNGGDGGTDAIQMVKNFGGAGGAVTSMIAWEAADFLTSVRVLESFDMEFETRGGTTTAYYLIETSAGWYQSDQTLVDNGSNNWGDSSKNIGNLTWTAFAGFGITDTTGGAAADTTDVLSVGAYFTSTLPSGNWTGAKLRYFKVTETSPIVQTDATYTDVSGAAAVPSATDLANQGEATFASSTVSANRSGETPEESFNDGITAENFHNMTWFLAGDGHFPATVTLNLDVATNTGGYNLTEINSIAGWNGGEQADQEMTVEYSVVGDAGFTTLGTFTNTSAGVGEYSRIGLTHYINGYLATGVDALRFTYADPEGVGAGTDRMVLQEIDVIGVPVPTATNSAYADVSEAAAVTSATDLANVGQATFASSTVSANQGADTPEDGFNDGAASDSAFENITWFHNGNGHLPAEVILNLDVTTYFNGYNISEINSIAGWGGGEQADQILTVECSVVGSAGWTQLGAGAFTNTDAGAGEYGRINLDADGYLATGVDALRFTYAATGNHLLLQEIDVIGDPVAVPLQLELSSMFSDDMILQREKAAPVWGTSAPGAGITVEFAGQTKMTTAAGDGTWKVDLDSMVASAVSRDLTVTANLHSVTAVVTFSNVLVGEVWVCSGQSNMAFKIGQTLQRDSVKLLPANTTLRLFKVPQATESTPLERIASVWTEGNTGTGSGTAHDFSAVAYNFGIKLQTELGIPVGLIESAKGGTIVEKWLPAGTSYNSGSAGVHYNGMIHALIPFAIRGAIWYQGESNLMEDGNDGQPLTYVAKKEALMNGWRSLWGEDFPFYYVQIAPFDYTANATTAIDDGILPFFWEAQSAILNEVTNTGMAVITDSVHDLTGATNLDELHPRNKEVPGERLALLALDNAYGQNIVSAGPTLQSLRLVGNKVEITFDSAVGLTTSDSLAPDWFELAGSDEIYEAATATVSGNKVILEASGVSVPEAMRFAWSEVAQPNLRNAAGLVASSFRADVPALTSHGTPHAWLNSFGLVAGSDYEAADLLDSDGDGQLNWQEYQAGTDPSAAASVFKMTRTEIVGGQFMFHWNAVSGKTYRIEYKADLPDASWTFLEGGVPGVEPESAGSLTMGAATKGFIRVSVE